MQPFRPAQTPSDFLNKAQSGFQKRPRIISPAVLQAAKSHAQATLTKLSGSPLANTPAGQALQKFIQSQLAKGQGLESLHEALTEKAKNELSKRRHMVTGLRELGRSYFTGADVFRLRSEVLMPAKLGRLTTTQAWQEIDNISFGRPSSAYGSRSAVQTKSSSAPPGKKPPLTVTLLEKFESKFGKLYFAVNAKAEGAAVLGGGASIGIGGFRHRQGFITSSYSIGLGCSADAQAGIELGISMQEPKNERKLGFEVALGIAGGLGVEATVSLKPSPGLGQQSEKNWKTYDGLIMDYEFDGLSVNISVGAGIDTSWSIAYSDSMLLRP